MEEISQHVLDLLMNSYEAGATDIHLAIQEDSKQDIFTITIRDNGKGMDKSTLQEAVNPFATNRTTRKVGLGLAFLEALAQGCNGKMSIASSPGNGCKVYIILQNSHWDKPPLGDMASTLTAFLCASSQIRLYYKHSVDDRCFHMDTNEIAKKVYPVPLNHVKILQWIKEYVKEGLKVLEKRGENDENTSGT